MRISITEYKTNKFGEIDNTVSAKITFEDLDVKDFSELLYFIRLINARHHVHVNYENNTKHISVIGNDFRKYIKTI